MLGILVAVAVLGGCIDSGKKLDTGIQTIEENNITLSQHPSNTSPSNIREPKSNQIRLILRPAELNRTGKLPVTLKIMNPGLNETVITMFRPQFGQDWYNKTNVTYVTTGNWTQNFSIRPAGNTSYVLMFVQVSENGTVVKKAAWNITFDTPVGTAR